MVLYLPTDVFATNGALLFHVVAIRLFNVVKMWRDTNSIGNCRDV